MMEKSQLFKLKDRELVDWLFGTKCPVEKRKAFWNVMERYFELYESNVCNVSAQVRYSVIYAAKTRTAATREEETDTSMIVRESS